MGAQVTIRRALGSLHLVSFFGITNFWNTSVCLFHKELNGPGPKDSEFINVRQAPYRTTLNDEETARMRAGKCVCVSHQTTTRHNSQ